MAHRDLYEPIDRCGGERSRDVQWEGGFRQPLLSKAQFDELDQNTDDCPYRSLVGEAEWTTRRDALSNGAYCEDMTWQSSAPKCDLGENAQSCGRHKNLVIFGYAHLFHSFRTSRDASIAPTDALNGQCVALEDGQLRATYLSCADGGPGSVDAVCYYGTHTK